MKIKKIYLDSSVIGGCFDEEFKVYSNILFDYFEQEIYIPILSQITIDEISKAPNNVIQKLKARWMICNFEFFYFRLNYMKINFIIDFVGSLKT